MDINLTQILFQLVNFGVVLGALTYFLYRPIMGIFEERSKRIADGQKAAQKALKSQEELEQMKKKAADKAKREEAKILKAAQEKAKQKRQELLAQAKAEAKEELEKQRAAWKKEHAQLLAQQKEEMVAAVMATVDKVLTSSVDAKVSSKLVDKELDAILKSL